MSVLFLPDGSTHPVSGRSEAAKPTILPEGSAVDLTPDPSNPSALSFLFSSDGQLKFAKRLKIGNEIIVPPAIDESILRTLHLPSTMAPCGHPSELVDLIEGYLAEAFDLAEESKRLVARFAWSTWVAEKLEGAPYLGICGPYESGKTSLLRFLHAVCRRAVLVGDLTPASVYRLAELLQPTLLIDEADFADSRMGADVKRLLRTGDTPGVPAFRNGKSFRTYCPKVLAARQCPDDAALSSRMLFIRMAPARRKLRPIDRQWLKHVADELQPKLLFARFRYFKDVGTSAEFESRTEHFTPRMRSLARTLASALLGNAHGEQGIIAMLAEQDEEARLERCEGREWLVARAIFALCHEPPVSRTWAVLVGGVASKVNESMRLQGDARSFSARSVGATMHAIGIRTRRLGAVGRGIEFTPSVRDQIHQVAYDLRISRRDLLSDGYLSDGYEAEFGGRPCQLCRQYGLTGGLKFAKMPTPRAVPHRDREARSARDELMVTDS